MNMAIIVAWLIVVSLLQEVIVIDNEGGEKRPFWFEEIPSGRTVLVSFDLNFTF